LAGIGGLGLRKQTKKQLACLANPAGLDCIPWNMDGFIDSFGLFLAILGKTLVSASESH
jgi:hypothetical protein